MNIQIHPIMLQQQCHRNSRWLHDYNPEYEWVVGYNLSTCDCGSKINAELHSVNKINDKYVDFTQDYANAKSKWFIPLKEQKYNIPLTNRSTMRELFQDMLKSNGEALTNWHTSHGNCTCDFRLLSLPNDAEYQCMKQKFKFLDRVKFVCEHDDV